ncbi:MAG: hypothetical protein QNJ44_22680 [Rhodobacter sp.]|nr:hypothetical protein [Rhodobacter sp.]
MDGTYAIFHGDEQIGKSCAPLDYMLDRAWALNRKAERARRPKNRACLTCGETFLSEGPHNRMCKSCRAKGDDLVPHGPALSCRGPTRVPA